MMALKVIFLVAWWTGLAAAVHHDRSGSGVYVNEEHNMLVEGQLCSVHVLGRTLANPEYGVRDIACLIPAPLPSPSVFPSLLLATLG